MLGTKLRRKSLIWKDLRNNKKSKVNMEKIFLQKIKMMK